MHLLRFLIVILMFVFAATSPVFAQTKTTKPPVQNIGSIMGKLIDNQSQPVSYATVTLLRADSSVINGDLTKDDGSFSISPTGIGDFRLRIESIGSTTKFVNVQVTADAPDKKLGKIKIIQSENTLKEVSVVGEKPIMELKVDKKVFNVEKNTTTAGGSATDVLQNVPSVSVDADGNVSLRGKSDVTILIDGKPSTMLGTDVASALQSLPAGSIESVEVITNPSAKYDAQGTSGIINIITKKDGRFGMNGTATLGAGTHDKYNGNLGLNVRKGKWNVFLNSSFRLNSTYNNVTTNRVDKPDSIRIIPQSYHTYEHVPHQFDGSFNSIGASFDPDKYNSITLTENINIMQFSFKDTSNYNVYGNPNETSPASYQQQRYSSFVGQPQSLSTALDYKHKFKKKDEELSIDATYAATTFRRKQDYTTIDTSSYTQHAPGIGTNNTLNVWADYTDPLFTKNGKLGLGFKSQFYWFTSSNTPTVNLNNIGDKFDSTLLSIYNYTQQIHAGYVNWNDQLGKFSYQAGLRLEDAVYDGNGQTPRDTSLHNSFLSLFPSAFISYQLENQQSIYLNYSRRTNRPGFRQLLPFVDLSNPGTVNTGNPSLIPEFINNIEFSYSKADNKGDNFILSAYYAYTQKLIEKITRPLLPNEAAKYGVPSSNLFTQPVNIQSGTTYGLEGTGHFQILPIWDATLNANFFENQLVIGNKYPELTKYLSNNSGFTWFGKVNTNIKLPKNFSFQVNANYESPKVIAQGNLKETYWVDLALRKNFWKNKATLILNCSDVFKTHVFVTDNNLNTYNETIDRVKETRIGNITFTYRFGKSDAGKSGGPNAGKHGKTMDDKNKPPKPTDEERDKNLKEGDDNDQGGGGGGNPGGKG
ncbi:MAG: TonB-dependent receptor domain-containing protein, partial [Chitinophagales bacterium]